MDFPRILGILNATEDSFSDGGQFFEPEAAIQKGRELWEEGAFGIDLGAQSSNPLSKVLDWKEEWDKIEKIWDGLQRISDFRISLDSYKPEILERALERRLDYWNDITSLDHPDMEKIIRTFPKPGDLPFFICMFSHNKGKVAIKKSNLQKSNLVETIVDFFQRSRDNWISWGIPPEKIIYDPGMGFFLGEDPDLSMEVLRNIPYLQEKLGKILVSVSRKSFLGNILGGLPPMDRRFGTFAAELYLASQNVEYIRTHEVRPVLDMIKVWRSINNYQ